MINEGKIKCMTKAAIFDSHEEKGNLHINHYYKSDYITYHVIRIFLGITLCFVLLAGMWALLAMDTLFETTQTTVLVSFGIRAVVLYVILTSVYVAIATIVYNIRYNAARKRVREYTSLLKRLGRYYQPEEKNRETTVEEIRS